MVQVKVTFAHQDEFLSFRLLELKSRSFNGVGKCSVSPRCMVTIKDSSHTSGQRKISSGCREVPLCSTYSLGTGPVPSAILVTEIHWLYPGPSKSKVGKKNL